MLSIKMIALSTLELYSNNSKSEDIITFTPNNWYIFYTILLINKKPEKDFFKPT